jgi:hypothetical protein
MKATVIAIDFAKDIDGTFKPLELNTNVDLHPVSQSLYLDSSKVSDFISNNNITSFEYIGGAAWGNVPHEPGTVYDIEAGEDQSATTDFGPRALEVIYSEASSSIAANFNLVQPHATTVPYIEDADDTLIFRNAYDSTALIDSTYAASSLAFLEFVNTYCVGDNALSIPNSFIAPSGSEGQTYGEMIGLEPVLDTIDNDSLRDNGVHPNYIIKLGESTVHSDYLNYPKLVKVTSAEQMQALKESLTGDLILQEYVYNPDDLVNGRAKTYRMVGALAGGQLEVLDFFTPYSVGNRLALPEQPDILGDWLQPWDRPAYVQKTNALNIKPGKLLWNTPLISDTGADVEFDSIQVNDVVSAIDVVGLSDNEQEFYWQNWSGSYDASGPVGNLTTANVVDVDKLSEDAYNFVNVVYYNDGADWLILGESALILTVDGDSVKFKKYFQLNVGDVITGVKKDGDGNTIQDNITISDLKVKYVIGRSGNLDIEEEDVVGVKGSDGETIFAVHNIQSNCVCYVCYGYLSNQGQCVESAYGACPSGGSCVPNTAYCSGGGYYYSSSGCGANK